MGAVTSLINKLITFFLTKSFLLNRIHPDFVISLELYTILTGIINYFHQTLHYLYSIKNCLVSVAEIQGKYWSNDWSNDCIQIRETHSKTDRKWQLSIYSFYIFSCSSSLFWALFLIYGKSFLNDLFIQQYIYIYICIHIYIYIYIYILIRGWFDKLDYILSIFSNFFSIDIKSALYGVSLKTKIK